MTESIRGGITSLSTHFAKRAETARSELAETEKFAALLEGGNPTPETQKTLEDKKEIYLFNAAIALGLSDLPIDETAEQLARNIGHTERAAGRLRDTLSNLTN